MGSCQVSGVYPGSFACPPTVICGSSCYNVRSMADTYAEPDSSRQVDNPLEAMQPGERIICEIKRHPVGMLSKYFATGFALVAIAIISLFAIPQLVSQASQTQAREYVLALLAFMGLLSLLGLYVSSTVYYKNRWIVTSDSITQIVQSGLFNAQTSQLSMANLQDITVVQDGLLPTMFNYGVLRAETAGERSKFMFLYCPDPKNYARQILMTRENFINTSPETAKRANDELAVPRPASNGLNIT